MHQMPASVALWFVIGLLALFGLAIAGLVAGLYLPGLCKNR